MTIEDNKDKNENTDSDLIQDNTDIVDSLSGIIPNNYTLEEVRDGRLSKK